MPVPVAKPLSSTSSAPCRMGHVRSRERRKRSSSPRAIRLDWIAFASALGASSISPAMEEVRTARWLFENGRVHRRNLEPSAAALQRLGLDEPTNAAFEQGVGNRLTTAGRDTKARTPPPDTRS